MGEVSEISWTHATWNPWIGCTRVSQGCVNCYAEAFAKRYGKAEWGPTAQRVRTSEAYWRQPFKWNRDAEKVGERRRVFCASLADVFEDNPQVVDWRAEALSIMEQTPWLDWLLLTKRPENINRMTPLHWHGNYRRDASNWPENVWIGTTVENQEAADERVPELLNVPARVRFLSCEPLLGPVDLSGRTMQTVWIDKEYADRDYGLGDLVAAEGWPIHWVIVGGESGPHARPMQADWARSLRDQCTAAGVAFHFKQWGGVNKKAAGRDLDGRTWDEYPAVAA